MTKKQKKKRSSPIDDNVILKQLLINGSPTVAAKALGLAFNTVNKRLQNPEFTAKLESLRGEMLQLAVDKMKSKLSSSVDFLTSVMEDPDVPISLRLQAANSFLSHTIKYIESVDFDKRLKALEDMEEL